MQKIVVAVDFSSETDHIVQHAIRVAKAFSGSIYLVHVEPPVQNINSRDTGEPLEDITHEYHHEVEKLHALAKQIREHAIETHAIFIEGVPSQSILDEAQSINAELIIMGTHGHGAVSRLLLGGVSQAIAKKTTCPVLLVPSRRELSR